MFTKIMWATDRSPTTERVLPLAKELAAGSGAKLIITHIEKITTVAPGNPSSWTASRRWTPTCATWWTSWSAKGSMQNSWKRRSVKGSAAHKLVELARDAGADLILLSSHGKGSLAGVSLGSIALDLLKIAPCPVLVVPWMHPDV